MSIIKLQNKGSNVAKVPSLYDKKQGGEPKTSSKGTQYVIVEIAPNHIASIDVCDATEEYIGLSNGKLVDVTTLVAPELKIETKALSVENDVLKSQNKAISAKNEALEKENEALKKENEALKKTTK